jgi:prolyl oligopeptidase
MTTETLIYPPAPQIPVAEHVSGVRFEDPYVWLEEDTPKVLEWQEAQSALAVKELLGWPGFDALRARLDAHATDTTVFAPRHHGRYWFQQVLPPGGEERAVLQVAESIHGPWRVLVNPNTMPSEHALSLDWYYPSPDASYVAFGLSQGGEEESVLLVVETVTGRLLLERLPYASGGFVSWMPDSSAFYHSGTEGPHTEQPYGRIYFHRLGEAERSQPEPIEYGDLVTIPQVSADGCYVAALCGHLELRPKFIRELPDGEWRSFVPSGFCVGVFVDDSYVAVDKEDHPRGRLVAIPVAHGGDSSTWRELVPESEAVLQSVARVGDWLVLASLVDVQAQLDILTVDGVREATVPLPEASVISTFSFPSGHPLIPVIAPSQGATDFSFVHQSLRSSAAIYRYDIPTTTLEAVTEPARLHRNFTIRPCFCTSTGEARVPYFMVSRDDIDLSGPQPALVHAYGGFNSAILPGYFEQFVEFVEAGGVFALVHARGGSEYGTSWWMDGRAGKKQHTFDDVYAAVEDMIAAGVTDAAHTAFVGFSNGGLLAGVVIAQRPELFRAVVPGIPILDLLHMARDPLTMSIARYEYGDPSIPEQAAWLYAYSPYHNLKDGVEYPATLLVTGAADVRCRAWHSRKYVARLQSATTSGRPVLMRVLGDIGHLTGMSPNEGSETTAEWLGFVMSQLGMKGP